GGGPGSAGLGRRNLAEREEENKERKDQQTGRHRDSSEEPVVAATLMLNVENRFAGMWKPVVPRTGGGFIPCGFPDKLASPMIIPTQPNFTVTSTADYRETYANSVQVRVNVWDFFLVFGTMQRS